MTSSALLVAVSFLPFFEAKNTVANRILLPPESGAAEVSTERPGLTAMSKCPACAGKGKITLVEPDYGQYEGRLGAPRKKSVTCPYCGGRGKAETFIDPAELSLQVAREREKFESDHLAKGDIPVGSAFVPKDVYNSLEAAPASAGDEDREEMRERKKRARERLKLVETAYGEPCGSCSWTGIEACGKCDGKGHVDCPNRNCRNGWDVEKTSTKTTKRTSGGNSGLSGGWRSSGSRNVTRTSEKINVSVCPDCGGAGMIPCPKCNGRKASPCGKCKGLGTKKKGR